jgi:nucleotide-binding universal stress UspA family protein
MNRTPRIVVGVDGFESSTAALRRAIPVTDLPDYQDDAWVVLTGAITEMCMVDAEVEVRPHVTERQARITQARLAVFRPGRAGQVRETWGNGGRSRWRAPVLR